MNIFQWSGHLGIGSRQPYIGDPRSALEASPSAATRMSHGSRPGLAEHFEGMGVGRSLPQQAPRSPGHPRLFDYLETNEGGSTHAKEAFILLLLLAMSAASRAATDDFDSFMGVSWVWILALTLYAVIGVILLLAFCHTPAASDAIKEKTYEARAPQGLSNVDSRIADRWSLRPSCLERLNHAQPTC
jgi:hypothetical protein